MRVRSFITLFATSLHRVELPTSGSSYVSTGGVETVAGGPHIITHTRWVVTLLLDLDVSYPSTDSGYVVYAFLNFVSGCDLAGSEDELPRYVWVSDL